MKQDLYKQGNDCLGKERELAFRFEDHGKRAAHRLEQAAWLTAVMERMLEFHYDICYSGFVMKVPV